MLNQQFSATTTNSSEQFGVDTDRSVGIASRSMSATIEPIMSGNTSRSGTTTNDTSNNHTTTASGEWHDVVRLAAESDDDDNTSIDLVPSDVIASPAAVRRERGQAISPGSSTTDGTTATTLEQKGGGAAAGTSSFWGSMFKPKPEPRRSETKAVIAPDEVFPTPSKALSAVSGLTTLDQAPSTEYDHGQHLRNPACITFPRPLAGDHLQRSSLKEVNSPTDFRQMVSDDEMSRTASVKGFFKSMKAILPGSRQSNQESAAAVAAAAAVGGAESPTDFLKESLVRPPGGANINIPSKVPNSEGFGRCCGRFSACMCHTWLAYLFIFAGMASGLAYGVYANRYRITDLDLKAIDWSEELRVAFLGNAYLFVNDVPRIMEAISDGHIYQDSVIHSSAGSLAGLLLTGNGMYQRWRTEEALLFTFQNYYGYNVSIFDYGMCTVGQLLQGYDPILTYNNKNNAYYNDGHNPCMLDSYYLDFIKDELNTTAKTEWDYVVFVDQTKRMAIEGARSESVYALANAYGPLLKQTGAIPIIVDTHAFWSSETNMTGLVDIPTFQSLIYDGVEEYVEALAYVLPDWQAPIVAPIGLAYLTIYEENEDMWYKLFIEDQMHSSLHGSYLFACVLYATMYGHLPPKSVSIDGIDKLFVKSRKLIGQDYSYPTADEAYYYRSIARRVALYGYVPESLTSQEN